MFREVVVREERRGWSENHRGIVAGLVTRQKLENRYEREWRVVNVPGKREGIKYETGSP